MAKLKLHTMLGNYPNTQPLKSGKFIRTWSISISSR